MKTATSPRAAGAPDQLGLARQEIDSLDDELLRLIERRFDLSLQIAALKNGEDSRLRIRPRRESQVLRRLIDRATTATPQLIAHVWRELMAHSVQAQVTTELILHAPSAGADLGDRVRERFGRAAPLVTVETPQEALDRARDHQAIAVIALGDSGWWARLAREPTLSIFDIIETDNGPVLLIGRIAPEDIAPGCEVVVREQASGERLARVGSLCLCRVSAR